MTEQNVSHHCDRWQWKARTRDCVIPVKLFPEWTLPTLKAVEFWNSNPNLEHKEYSVALVAFHWFVVNWFMFSLKSYTQMLFQNVVNGL